MKQIGSKTNLERADANAKKKLKENQEAPVTKQNIVPFNEVIGFSVGTKYWYQQVCFQVIKTILTVENVWKTTVFRLTANHYTNRIFWSCDKHQLKNKHLAF